MFLLRWVAYCFIWIALFSLFFILVGLAIIFFHNGGAFKQTSYAGNYGIQIPSLPPFKYYNVFGGITIGLAVIVLLMIICCCSRIRLAIVLCGIGGEFIAKTLQILLVPLIMSAVTIVFWVFAIYGMLTIISTAQFVVNNNNDVFTSIKNKTSRSLGMFYYFVFGSLWTNALLIAITTFVIASACAVWYFSKAPGMEELDSPVCSGFWMTFRYHFGSLAFGSFILALVQFIQFLFEIFNRQIEASGPGANACF